MKKIVKGVVFVIMLIVMTVMLPAFMDSIGLFGSKAEAEDADWSEVPLEPDPPEDPAITPTKFLILEITPYKGMGEIGYLVGGEEPIDEELFTYKEATGDLKFLGGAITPYDSYVEKPVPSSGSEKGWIPIQTYITQNGYFEYVGPSNGGTYKVNTGQTIYTRVADGTGTHNAVLNTENTKIYTETWNQTNLKNVNAYFVYGKTSGAALYSTTNAYEPCSVTRNTESKGDYDYNSEKKTFYLNKGKGTYDVLFARSTGSKNLYYMLADYEIVEDSTGEYSWSLSYSSVGTTGGNYKENTNGMIFTYKLNDTYNYRYRWVPSEEALNKPSNFYREGTAGQIGEKIWVQGQKIQATVQYAFHVTLVNNEWFKRLTLGIAPQDCEGYEVDVVTMTPTELNLPANQHYLREANMFYINANYSHNQSYIDLYEQKSYVGSALTEGEKFQAIKDTLDFAQNDLSWSSTMMVFNRITGVKSDGTLGGYRAAVVFDNTFYKNAVYGNGAYNNFYERVTTVSFTWNDSGATICNLAKLYVMIYQRDPVDFYKTFINPLTAPVRITQVNSTRNSTGTTGSFVRPDTTTTPGSANAIIEATFWNGNTFCAYVLNDSGGLVALNIDNSTDKAIIEEEIPNYNITKKTTDMIANVLTLNGQDIFTSKFIEPLYNMPADSVEAAKIYWAAQNGGVIPSNVNLFAYINLVTNEGAGYVSGDGSDPSGEDGTSGSNLRTYTSVLNIQPTADFTASENRIRTMLEDYNLKIVNMTSSEFNSSILDINTHFDMIYIGGGTGRFNNVSSNTVYNKAEDVGSIPDDKLNGSVYHKGDRVLTAQGSKNYTGNDITAQKITELEEFLDAGYPIVLENNLYTLSIAVHSSTNLHQFIQAEKADSTSNVFNYNDYTSSDSSKITFMGKLTYCLKIVRPMIRMLEPILESGSSLNYIYVDPISNKLNIEFSLVPRGLVADRTYTYNAYLYLDYNEDGIFAEAEKLNAIPQGSYSANGITESKFKAYLYNYDMSAYNGVYQWQVKVVRQQVDPSTGISYDTPVRSEITGYAACSKPQDLITLQITDNETDTTAYPIESILDGGSSLIAEYAGYGLTELKDYNLIFKSMTVDQFLAQYEDEPYSEATPEEKEATNQLADYHLLIMDNQIDSISDTNGALSNIRSEIREGLGVVFTKGAINYNNQSQYLDFTVFENQKTYPKLSHIATPTSDDPYYIFDFNLSSFSTPLNQEITYRTTYATKANEGADSQYPYKIGDALKIAETSYMEDASIDYNRSDSLPLIGWYCLSDSRSPVVRSAGISPETANNTYTGIYSSSPEDVKNNYYLFNRGRIYFSGIQLHLADTEDNDSEIKLFINTIIAAYKTSGRILPKAPVITIHDDMLINNTITLTSLDLEGLTVRPIYFSITESSSNMNFKIEWKDDSGNPAAATDDWNKKLYFISDDGTKTLITDLTDISKGNYCIYIPVGDLEGSHTLSLSAENKQKKKAVLNTTIKYSVNPLSVEIKNSDLIKNVDKGEQYLYIDIDYAAINNEEAYLSNSDTVRIEFDVSNVSDTASVHVIDVDLGGSSLNVKDNKIYNLSNPTLSYYLNLKVVPNGSYYMDVPVSVMKNISSKKIRITAQEGSSNGSAEVILLRRNLFPLD